MVETIFYRVAPHKSAAHLSIVGYPHQLLFNFIKIFFQMEEEFKGKQGLVSMIIEEETQKLA